MARANIQGSSQASQTLEDSVISGCCKVKFFSSFNFKLETTGKLDYQISLFEKSEDGSPFFSKRFTYTEKAAEEHSEQDYQTQKRLVPHISEPAEPQPQLEHFVSKDDVKTTSTVKCPFCEKQFELSINLHKTITNSNLKIELSLTTKEDHRRGSVSFVEDYFKCPENLVGKTIMKNEPRVRQPQSKDQSNGSTYALKFLVTRTVKAFFTSTGETFHGDDQVKEQLGKSQFLDEFSIRIRETTLEDSDIIIVFCPVTSRVGSDVESSMKETVSSWNKPVILILMHHTRDVDYSTAGTIWSDVYPNVVLDVHILFHETKPGLLECRQNDQAFKNIKKELQKHGKVFI